MPDYKALRAKIVAGDRQSRWALMLDGSTMQFPEDFDWPEVDPELLKPQIAMWMNASR